MNGFAFIIPILTPLLYYIIAMTENLLITTYLKRYLTTRFIGTELHYFEDTTSTIDIAKSLAEKGAPAGTVVIAKQQSAGRGRLDHTWLSPAGGLFTSIILRPPASALRLLPAIASLGVLHALKQLGIQAAIKWPNDVLISGKKVSGVLIENRFESGDLKYSVVSIGMNVNLDMTRFPEIRDISTSLSFHLGREIPVCEVALNLYSTFEKFYGNINNPEAILSEWANNMVTMGKRVTVNTGGCVIEGTAEAINREGNLLLRLDSGLKQEIVAGDVSNIRDKTD